jgi:hypothetical protein
MDTAPYIDIAYQDLLRLSMAVKKAFVSAGSIAGWAAATVRPAATGAHGIKIWMKPIKRHLWLYSALKNEEFAGIPRNGKQVIDHLEVIF